jgi:hypothetical protein
LGVAQIVLRDIFWLLFFFTWNQNFFFRLRAGKFSSTAPSLDDVELPGVDTDFDAEPTGVEVDSAYVTPKHTEVNGLGQQDPSVAPTEEPSAEPPTGPTVETQAPSEPKKGTAARNVRNKNQPEKYVPSMKGNKYTVAPTQIAASLKGSKHAMAQMSVKLMNKGAHRRADVVGMIMAQISKKIEPIKKWGLETEYAITEEMTGVASQGTAFAQKQKDLEDKKSVHINKSARRIKSLTNNEECQNCGKTGHPAECNYNKECQNCGKTGHPAICCLHKKIVFLIEEGSADEIPGVNSPDGCC